MAQASPMKIFLLRHATPDWSRKDIPYDILPGPELSPKGEAEAQALAEFIKLEGLKKLYTSPFERAAQTAKIVAAANGIPCIEEQGISEWRGVDESESQVRARMSSVFERVAQESTKLGPIGLVSHGGPIALLLLELGFPHDELAPYRKMFDTTNPLPPAGAWKIKRVSDEDNWDFQLVFTPNAS
jgi:2,3-bisphosphoglycerate-dependent phosphoglycerate mutase